MTETDIAVVAIEKELFRFFPFGNGAQMVEFLNAPVLDGDL